MFEDNDIGCGISCPIRQYPGGCKSCFDIRHKNNPTDTFWFDGQQWKRYEP